MTPRPGVPNGDDTVFINGRFLSQGVTGVQRYATELVRALDRLVAARVSAHGPSWCLLAPPDARRSDRLAGISVRTVGVLRGHLWEQLELPRFARSGLLLNLANTAPLSHKHQIVTVHDASVFTVPQAYSRTFRLWYRFLLPRIGKRAALILTVSEFSRSELAAHAGIPPSRQRVVPEGCEHILAIPPDETVLRRHSLGERPFILAVGSSSPHKNLALATGALTYLARLDCPLVIAGGDNRTVFRPADRHWTQKAIWLGYIPDSELRALYERAACFVYPSVYEGFGLPPLEAMACGCPTLVARAGSLPEVCGDAAGYFDPNDSSDLAREIERVVTNETVRNAMRARGRERAKSFNWDRAARAILEILSEFLPT